MSNEKRIILLAGAMIVAALWFRVLAFSANPTEHVVKNIDAAEVIQSKPISSGTAQAAIQEEDDFSRICTDATGSPVRCSETDEDMICIRTRVGTYSGIKIDCFTGQPIPTAEDSTSRTGRASYRSPY